MKDVVGAALIGMLVVLVATIPRNLVFAANLRYFASVPWAVPLLAAWLWLFWRYAGGHGPPATTAQQRRASLRANPLGVRVWGWALGAGGLGIVALVFALRLLNRVVALPVQQLPDLAHVPASTMVPMLLMSALFAGVVEEAAFRGYMQGPIERRFGLPVAILITGTMFALAHLDFTPVLWPYYVAVAAIYGTVTYLTSSILPAIVLHAAGNTYSNLDLWLHGRADWQSSGAPLVSETGLDASFVLTSAACVAVTAAAVWAYVRLAAAARPPAPRALRARRGVLTKGTGRASA